MDPPLPIDGVLPPDLQGTLVRVGPGDQSAGALHAIELRDGTAVSLRSHSSEADANVFWHAGSILALAETGLPQQFSRTLEPEEFGGGLTRPIASHVHRDPVDGSRVLFGVEPATEASAPVLHIGDWDAGGALTRYRGITLERATWQHDIGVTPGHAVFLESPTEFGQDLSDAGAPIPYRWTPGAEGWIGVVDRAAEGSDVRWIRHDPCLVTHVLHAHDEDSGAVVLYVVRYEVPERGQPIDLDGPVVGADGIGMSRIGRGLGVLERWRIQGASCERDQVDDRYVEYPRSDPLCEGRPFRHGYSVEVAPGVGGGPGDGADVDQLGLLKIDTARDQVREWRPGEYRVAGEPLFVRAADGEADDEGWLLTIVHDAAQGASDLYVLDASSFGPGRAPQAVVHLPASLPFRSHGTWVGADRYR
ncbi:MAG: carotenoid oxygenase family protein [Acidimicrobiales bacterium]